MINLDRDDRYHLAAIAWIVPFAFFSGRALINSLKSQALENKIYECACHVITNTQEYGCPVPSLSMGTSITELCKEGGVLQRMHAPTGFDVKFHTGVFAFFVVLLSIGFVVLIIKPCARYQEYQDKKKIS